MNATLEWESSEQQPAITWLMETSGLPESESDDEDAAATLQGAGAGALSGAAMGASLGPYGAAAGGVIGGIMGAVNSRRGGSRQQPSRTSARAPQRAASVPPQRSATPTPSAPARQLARPVFAGQMTGPAGGQGNYAQLSAQVTRLTAAVIALAQQQRQMRSDAAEPGDDGLGMLGEPVGGTDASAGPADVTEVLESYNDNDFEPESSDDEAMSYLESLLEPSPDVTGGLPEDFGTAEGLPEVDIEDIRPTCQTQDQSASS